MEKSSSQVLSKALADFLAKRGLQLLIETTKWGFLTWGPVGYVFTTIVSMFLERLLKESFLAGHIRLLEREVNGQVSEVRLILENYDPKNTTPEEIHEIDEKLKSIGRDFLSF